jgi:nucleoside-diphosphate-sugar epimerase
MPAKSRTVLVTGGAGFIGLHLVDALIGGGLRVRILDNLSTGTRRNLNPDAELIEGDLRDFDSIRRAFVGVDTVFHEAALARVPLSIDKPVGTHMVNALGTLHVLLAARDAGVRRVVFAGSSSVYGDQDALPLHEQMTPNLLNPYALQKLVGEKYPQLFHKLYGMQTLTLRYFNQGCDGKKKGSELWTRDSRPP